MSIIIGLITFLILKFSFDFLRGNYLKLKECERMSQLLTLENNAIRNNFEVIEKDILLLKGYEQSNDRALSQLTEKIFLLQHDIKFDPCYQKIIYDFRQSFVNNIYHIEIKCLSFDDLGMDPSDNFFADTIQVKIMLADDVVKELEVNKEFYSISEIYRYLDPKIRQFETDSLVINEVKI